jgi:hypothetical protein
MLATTEFTVRITVMQVMQGGVRFLSSRQINIKLTSYKMRNGGSHLATVEQLFELTTSKLVRRPFASCYVNKNLHARTFRQVLASLTFPYSKLRITRVHYTRYSPASSLAASKLATPLTRSNVSGGQLLTLCFSAPSLR